MRRTILFLALALGVTAFALGQIFAPIIAGGPVWYVDPVSGNDSNAGSTSGAALKTISAASAKPLAPIKIKVNGAYQPLGIPSGNVMAWWRADALSGNDGDLLASWADLSGNGRTVAQGTTGSKPSLKLSILNGYQVVRFNGTSSQMGQSAGTSINPHGPMSVFAVVVPSSIASSARLVSGAFGFGRNGVFTRFTTPSIKNYDSTASWLSVSTPVVYGAVFNSSWSTNFWVNSWPKDVVTGSSVMNTYAGNTNLGANNANGEFYGADVAEIVVYNGDVGTAVAHQLGAYWGVKYGVYVPGVDAWKATATNAPSALTTPTYDGSGQGMHPSVLYIPAQWNGWEYWMAMTPYPGSDTTKENPSILVSHDGTTWQEPVGITNPVSGTAPATYANSDPDIIIGPDNVMYLFYRQYNPTPQWENIYLRTSTDGVTWSAATLVLQTASVDAQQCMSPSIVYTGTQWEMYYVRHNGAYVIGRRTAPAPAGTWSAETLPSLTGGPGTISPWHMDVNYENGLYYGVYTDASGGGRLFFMTSNNGTTWEASNRVMLDVGGVGAWDHSGQYRASMVRPSGGGTSSWDLFYSARGSTGPDVWHTGRTTITGF